MDEFENLNWQEAAAKGRSKREIYTILVVRGKYYLPLEAQASSDYVHDVMIGRKRVKSWSFTHLGLEAKRCYNDVCTPGQRTKSAPDFKRSQKALLNCWFSPRNERRQAAK